MKLLYVAFTSIALVACGGGDPQDSAVPIVAPHAVVKATKPTGGAAIALHLYQALYGRAPSYALMTEYTAQATSDASVFAQNLAAAFASTSNTVLAKLVLDNLGVTAATVKAVNSKGESEYALLLAAVEQIFGAYPTMRAQVILNMTNLFEGLEADVTYGGAAVTYNNQAAANHTYATNAANTSPSTVAGPALSFAGAAGADRTFLLYAKVVDGAGTAARFILPMGMVADPSGNLYVADTGAHNVRKITPQGLVTTFAGPAGADCTAQILCPKGYTDGTGSVARFSAPRGMTIDSLGNLYVGNYYSIRKISPAGVVSTLAGPNSTLCTPSTGCVKGFINGTGTAARFAGIMSMATDAADNLYVVDLENKAVRKISPAGVVSTFFTAPQAVKGGIAVDAAGNVYVGNGFPSGIWKITPAGVSSTFVSGVTADDIAIDSAGNLFVSHFYGMKISQVTPAGVITASVVPTTLVGNDASFPTLVPGAGNDGAVNNSYIAISGASLYIAQKTAIGVVNPRP